MSGFFPSSSVCCSVRPSGFALSYAAEAAASRDFMSRDFMSRAAISAICGRCLVMARVVALAASRGLREALAQRLAAEKPCLELAEALSIELLEG